MILFLNESSLENSSGLVNTLHAALEISVKLDAYARKLRDSEFCFSPIFKSRLNIELAKVADPQYRALLRNLVHTNRYWKCWRESRISDCNDIYTLVDTGDLIHDQSICEAAEVVSTNTSEKIGLISDGISKFSKFSAINITKMDSATPISIPNACTADVVMQWLQNTKGYYDSRSTVAPADFQTILVKDPVRFKSTNRTWKVAGKNRRIFKENTTGYYYLVDEGHWGHAAHLEVFNSIGAHLGEATIDHGILDRSKMDSEKSIII